MKRLIPVLLLGVIIASASCDVRVDNLGVFGKAANSDVLGQDGVTPIPFDEKTCLWTFGDTILGSWKGDVSAYATFSDRVNVSSMLSNSLAFTDAPTDVNVSSLKFRFYREKGRVVQFIRYRKGEKPGRDRLWAADGIRAGNCVYVYYMNIRITDPKSPLSFKLNGIGLARWRVPEGWKPGQRVEFERLPDVFPSGFPAFGTCVIKQGEYLYTIGHYSSQGLSSPVKIARVKINSIEKGQEYEFLTREGFWVKDIDKAEQFLGDVMGECSLSYNRFLKRYVIVYCQMFTGKIVMVSFKDFSLYAI